MGCWCWLVRSGMPRGLATIAARNAESVASFLERGDLSRALTHYSMRPNLAAALALLRRLQNEQGCAERALEVYNQLQRRSSHKPNATVLNALSLCLVGEAGRSRARLAHLLWGQMRKHGVALTPTTLRVLGALCLGAKDAKTALAVLRVLVGSTALVFPVEARTWRALLVAATPPTTPPRHRRAGPLDEQFVDSVRAMVHERSGEAGFDVGVLLALARGFAKCGAMHKALACLDEATTSWLVHPTPEWYAELAAVSQQGGHAARDGLLVQHAHRMGLGQAVEQALSHNHHQQRQQQQRPPRADLPTRATSPQYSTGNEYAPLGIQFC